MDNKPLEGKVALVTGATRGIGKGIALQLAEAGALVYITGRTMKGNSGSLEQTVAEIKERSGLCVPVQCDHEIDSQVADVFKRIESEQKGQLDILVNNAYKAVKTIIDNRNLTFWEQDTSVWDTVNNVGLRNHYFCTVYAARLMVPRQQGLIVNISSIGGSMYFFNVSYGIGKAAFDRMAADCGIELRKHNVAVISLWPGAVHTEVFDECVKSIEDLELPIADLNGNVKKFKNLKEKFLNAESPEFAGKCIVALALDPNVMKLSSKVVIAEDYAAKNGIRDIDNRVIPSFRQVNLTFKQALPKSIQFLAQLIPNFVKIPLNLFTLYTSKF